MLDGTTSNSLKIVSDGDCSWLNDNNILLHCIRVTCLKLGILSGAISHLIFVGCILFGIFSGACNAFGVGPVYCEGFKNVISGVTTVKFSHISCVVGTSYFISLDCSDGGDTAFVT